MLYGYRRTKWNQVPKLNIFQYLTAWYNLNNSLKHFNLKRCLLGCGVFYLFSSTDFMKFHLIALGQEISKLVFFWVVYFSNNPTSKFGIHCSEVQNIIWNPLAQGYQMPIELKFKKRKKCRALIRILPCYKSHEICSEIIDLKISAFRKKLLKKIDYQLLYNLIR